MAQNETAQQGSPGTHAPAVIQTERCPTSLGPAGHHDSAGDPGTNQETSATINQTTMTIPTQRY
jgi:hypothetical protein